MAFLAAEKKFFFKSNIIFSNETQIFLEKPFLVDGLNRILNTAEEKISKPGRQI